MTTAETDKIHSVGFAPRVLALGLSAEAVGENRAAWRPPWSKRLPREGGGPSGGRWRPPPAPRR
ncbi:hypothetical protein [Streptomyces shenzhenensis]|uniref:Uncharacterized protein n=1 Tax=Streptomyces shenzhenensis TaxID=943815 RepID=A0A3M0IAE2_9ACTN|nr:hypothetical protein CTZ28_11140 [Streptomyces shenzhenensis]